MENDLDNLIKQSKLTEDAFIDFMQNHDKHFETIYRREVKKLETMKEQFLQKYNKVKTFNYISEYETNVETER